MWAATRQETVGGMTSRDLRDFIEKTETLLLFASHTFRCTSSISGEPGEAPPRVQRSTRQPPGHKLTSLTRLGGVIKHYT